jgi:chain length determinant protein (polysaccharide antigen chain regulator)
MYKNGVAESSSDLNLLELLKDLWQQKWLIVIVVSVFVFVSALYAYLSTPVYEAKFYILPPSVENIASLNYGRNKKSELAPLTVDNVYKVFIKNLQSEDLRQYFFQRDYFPSLNRPGDARATGALYDEFSKGVIIGAVDKEPNGRWSVAIQGGDPEKVTDWVKKYVEYAGQRAEAEVVSSVKKEASVLARNTELQIDSLRVSAKKVREDSISRLREALAVAKASGLENSVVFTGGKSSELAGNMSGEFAYMRGSKALEAELKNLEGRQSNDPFIKGLRGLQADYSYYMGVEAGDYKVSTYRQDGMVDQPVSPIKPKKSFIIFLGFVGGMLTGFMIAFTRSFIRKLDFNSL